MNIKFQSVSDENYIYKRDKILYEKDIKIKKDTIEKLRNSYMGNNPMMESIEIPEDLFKSREEEGKNEEEGKRTIRALSKRKSQHRFKKLRSDDNEEENNNEEEKDEKANMRPVKDKRKQKEEDDFEKLPRADKINKLTSDITALNGKRDTLNNQLTKMPAHPKKKADIDKKRETEEEIEKIGNELAKLKMSVRMLKEEEKDLW